MTSLAQEAVEKICQLFQDCSSLLRLEVCPLTVLVSTFQSYSENQFQFFSLRSIYCSGKACHHISILVQHVFPAAESVSNFKFTEMMRTSYGTMCSAVVLISMVNQQHWCVLILQLTNYHYLIIFPISHFTFCVVAPENTNVTNVTNTSVCAVSLSL